VDVAVEADREWEAAGEEGAAADRQALLRPPEVEAAAADLLGLRRPLERD